MFDIHRHLCLDTKPNGNAFYATSAPSQWEQVYTLGPIDMGGIGVLKPAQFPPIGDVETALHSHPSLQIAEVGLDRRYDDPAGQRRFLIDILHLARGLGRSVTLHCVQQEGALLSLLQEERKNLPVFLWHGFTGSWETAMQIKSLQGLLSFGPRLYKSKLAQWGKALATLPYALESDYDGQHEEPYQEIWSSHIQAFSSLTGLCVEQLERNNDEVRTILAHDQAPR